MMMDTSFAELAHSYGFYDAFGDADDALFADDDRAADDLLDQLLEANDAMILEGLKKQLLSDDRLFESDIPDDAVHRHRHDCMLMGYCVDNQHGTIDRRTMPEWLVTVREMRCKPPQQPPNKGSLLKPRNHQQQPQQNQQQQQECLFSPETKDLLEKQGSFVAPPTPEKKQLTFQHHQGDMPPCLGRLVQHACNPLEDSCLQTNIDAELSDYLSATDTIEDLYEAVMVNEVYSEESQEDSMESDVSDEEEEIEDEEEEVEEEHEPPEVHNDHSYHKNCFEAQPPPSFLGIVTPSDSEEEEEEVDVVTVTATTEKHLRGRPLPTNPSTSDRQSIQRALVTAYANKQQQHQQQLQHLHHHRHHHHHLHHHHHHHQRRPPSPLARRGAACARRRNRRARRSAADGCGADLEPAQKRKLHNHMERKRRIDLATAFSGLKRVVPKIEKKDKASKINILKEAADYCRFLTNKSLVQQRERARLQQENHGLEQRLRQLKAAAARN